MTMADTTIKRCERGDAMQPERTRQRWAYTPSCDIIEQQDALLVLADMPGVNAGDVDIQYENGVLSIHGRVEPRRNEEQTHFVVREYGVGDYYRSFQVGEGVDSSRIQATLREGVLELHLPKAEATRPHKISVQSA
jgi:HSP20 family protein